MRLAVIWSRAAVSGQTLTASTKNWLVSGVSSHANPPGTGRPCEVRKSRSVASTGSSSITSTKVFFILFVLSGSASEVCDRGSGCTGQRQGF